MSQRDYRQIKPQKDGVRTMICYLCQQPLQEEKAVYAHNEPIHPECKVELEQ